MMLRGRLFRYLMTLKLREQWELQGENGFTQIGVGIFGQVLSGIYL
jgi:hypothetical protein